MYQTKNYTKQGGGETVIGGKLIFETGATVEGDGAADLSTVATDTTLGGVKAATKGAGDTVVAKIGADGKLYVPAYPTGATGAAAGLVKQTPAIADLAGGADAAAITTKVNAVLAAMRTAGMVAAE